MASQRKHPIRVPVMPADSGARLDKFLTERIKDPAAPGFKRSFARAALEILQARP
jgi:hypothetical protein